MVNFMKCMVSCQVYFHILVDNSFIWIQHILNKKDTSSFEHLLHTKNVSVLCLVTDDKMPASVAQLDAPSDWRPGGSRFNPHQGRQHSFVEIDPEIFSTVILSLPLIQEGQLSVSGARMCTVQVNRLED